MSRWGEIRRPLDTRSLVLEAECRPAPRRPCRRLPFRRLDPHRWQAQQRRRRRRLRRPCLGVRGGPGRDRREDREGGVEMALVAPRPRWHPKAVPPGTGSPAGSATCGCAIVPGGSPRSLSRWTNLDHGSLSCAACAPQRFDLIRPRRRPNRIQQALRLYLHVGSTVGEANCIKGCLALFMHSYI